MSLNFKEIWDDRFLNYANIITIDSGSFPQKNLGGWGHLNLGLDGSFIEQSNTDHGNHLRMNLVAAVQALQFIPLGWRVLLLTHEEYTYNLLTDWMFRWEAKGWDVQKKNLDLAEQLYSLTQERQVEVELVTPKEDSPYGKLYRYVHEKVTQAMQREVELRALYSQAVETLLKKREERS